MSKQRPLNTAEYQVEQALNDYIRHRAGCEKTWYEKLLPVLFSDKCGAVVTFYSGVDRDGKAMGIDSTGSSFLIHVSDRDGAFCRRDSLALKPEARYLARQIRPLLASGKEYDWISVSYSSCTSAGNDPQSCSGACDKYIRLAVQDTTAWSEARLSIRQEFEKPMPVQVTQ